MKSSSSSYLQFPKLANELHDFKAMGEGLENPEKTPHWPGSWTQAYGHTTVQPKVKLKQNKNTQLVS